MNFSAVILAGGKSKRMGWDKTWLPVSGKSLIARQIELVREIGAAEVFISGRAETDYGALDCPVLTDRFEDAGPLAGIQRALGPIYTPLLLVLAVDMPRMNAAQLQMLLSDCPGKTGVIPRFQSGTEPLGAVYPKSALGLATQLLEKKNCSARHFAKCCVELKLATFMNLSKRHSPYFENWNTPLDISEPDLLPSR